MIKKTLNILDNIVTGESTLIDKVQRTVSQTKDIYQNTSDLGRELLESTAYFVEVYNPESAEDCLQFGISHLNPGTVNGEFFMTKGHFHEKKSRDEFYIGMSGKGLLLIMKEDRSWYAEEVCEGSIHYIPGHQAHRLVNVGEERLDVAACWNADSGHDYGSIATDGFSVRVFKDDNSYKLVEVK